MKESYLKVSFNLITAFLYSDARSSVFPKMVSFLEIIGHGLSTPNLLQAAKK